MVRHIVDGNQFLFLTGDDAGDVLLEFIVVFRLDEVLSAFDSKHDVNVDLRVGVGHLRKMPLLTELENPFFDWFLQRCRPWRGWRSTALDIFLSTTARTWIVSFEVFDRRIDTNSKFDSALTQSP